ncbi:MAG: hypothetical protein JWN66_2739 [Sphingomonas bacterium]|uniref:hypothetical protein n=1 Tax=Sphingomonas bacterium TaxID=1895847 RepID=UPI00262AE196|nr:hypothetical protein [Sphingomonas bacterium]MDB5705623.1 hypothetical protein [Sphingomonas bacterium]
MHNTDRWSCFDQAYCLTLEGDIERQRNASNELCAIGLRGFRFVEGFKANSEEVCAAYAAGRVHDHPTCFRCARQSCGSDDCNNIIIPAQVGCFLGFMKIFETAVASGLDRFLVTEDDVRFHPWAGNIADVALTKRRLSKLGLFSDEPCIIGLGRRIVIPAGASRPTSVRFLQEKTPQNHCFAFNRAFAELALRRFDKVSHTADVFIHMQLASSAHHHSLESPLAHELSFDTGEFPSRIHPKEVALARITEPGAHAEARAAVLNHLKHAQATPLSVIGAPRGGTAYMSHALGTFGLDVGHERLGADGICSWMHAVSGTDLPFGEDMYARNSRFVWPEKVIAVVRTSPNAIFSTLVENAKNPQSYAFRRRWIKREFDLDLDRFRTDFERALAAYVFWYRLVERKNPVGWIALERASAELPTLFSSGLLTARQEPDVATLAMVINRRKLYFGHSYDPPEQEFGPALRSADSFLRTEYGRLRDDLWPVFGPLGKVHGLSA